MVEQRGASAQTRTPRVSRLLKAIVAHSLARNVRKTLGRQVNPTVYTAEEFAKRARSENAAMTQVLGQPKIWIIGVENDVTGARRSSRATREGLDLRWAPAPSRDEVIAPYIKLQGAEPEADDRFRVSEM